jgi:hypothetical protein
MNTETNPLYAALGSDKLFDEYLEEYDNQDIILHIKSYAADKQNNTEFNNRMCIAVQAMSGILARTHHDPDLLAKKSIKYADALIKELQKGITDEHK